MKNIEDGINIRMTYALLAGGSKSVKVYMCF